MKRFIILALAYIFFLEGKAQTVNPGENEIYREGEIAIVKITMNPTDKAFMLDEANIWSDVYLPAQFRFINSLMDTTLSFNVGIRLRGNTSRSHPKKSFKLKFKEFGGEKFYDLKKFNLKAENNDPSMIRELMTLQTFRKANAPAARSHHAEVYINDEYMGLYLNVEQIDDEFVQARFFYDEGNLYKCSWGATLTTENAIYDNNLFELEINEDINDRSGLANFIQVLNNTPDADFEEAIESVFNVTSYLRVLAVEALTGHWDGYSFNQNNFYLYENNATGLIEFIPYDVDNTFGMDWVDRDWATRDVLDWPKHGEPRPLTKRILGRERYFYLYKAKLDALLNGDFSEAYFYPVFDSFKSMLDNSVLRDTYFPLTFGFTYTDFQSSYTEQVVDHAPYGLKPYVYTRTTTARDQVGEILGLETLEKGSVEVYPNPVSGGEFSIIVDRPLKLTRIIDAMGRVYSFKVEQRSSFIYKIEMDAPAGLYFLNIGESVHKILIED
ncbi:MAG: CotH kinase family protein [Bacteroidota bacterium]